MKNIFFDIDGTLLSYEKGICPSTVEALKIAKQNGHRIFICTGRSYAEIPTSIYKFDFDGVIAAAGGFVKVKDEVIFNKTIPDSLVDTLIQHLSQTNIAYVLEGVDEVYSHKDAIYSQVKKNEKMLKIKNETNYEFAAYEYRIERIKSIADYYDERTKISKMTLYASSRDEYEKFAKLIDKDFYVLIYNDYAEIVANGVSKFTGIEKVVEYLKEDISSTVSLGDSLNDYDMIKGADIGIAVGNASEPVKEVADFVTDHIHEDGIYNALKHFNII